MRRVWICALVCASCGGTAPRAEAPSTDCQRACDDAAAAWNELADRADEAARPSESRPPIPAEDALARIREHASDLAESPREVTGEEAMALSGAVMDAVDAIQGELPFGLRERADDAAEALLVGRGERAASRAAEDAMIVLEEIIRTVDPGSAYVWGRALAGLAAQAREVATSYGETAGAGDEQATAAERVALPDDAPVAFVQLRERAAGASAHVRDVCELTERSRALRTPF